MKNLKPRIVASKCLEFDACRFNGEMVADKVVKKLADHVEFVPICPEVEIGMGVPRDPIRLVKEKGEIRLKQPSTKKDFTQKMNSFSDSFLLGLKEVDGFILKGRSPSCGISGVKVYPKMEKSPVAFKNMGVFAKKVHEIYPNHPLEEEGRLTNLFIREHFLTAVYTLASFRQLLKNPSAAGLVKFQTQNKFLLLAYNQKLMREMGRLVSGQKEAGLKTTMEKYQELLRLVFRKQPRRVSNINTHMHALGYFSDELTSDEKAYFLDTLEKFRNGIVPLSVLNSLTWSWIVRFKEDYLRHQTYFQPFPESLLDHLDSGKKQRVYQSV